MQDITNNNSVIDMATQSAPLAVAFLAAVLADKNAPNKERLQAAAMILDRAVGKPKQQIEQEVTHRREPLTIEEAAKRIAFTINSAIRNNKVIDAEYVEIVKAIKADKLPAST